MLENKIQQQNYNIQSQNFFHNKNTKHAAKIPAQQNDSVSFKGKATSQKTNDFISSITSKLLSKNGLIASALLSVGYLALTKLNEVNISDPNDKKMYKEISANLDKNGKNALNNLVRSNKLFDKNSNDKSSTIQNLYTILKQPRVQGLDNRQILKETVATIADPYIINQNFGAIPNNLKPAILNMQQKAGIKPTDPSKKTLNPQDLDVPASGTCVAASIEFNLATSKPAEYARYVAGLTSPAMSVKTTIKTKDIADNIFEAQKILKQFKTNYKIKDWHNIDLTLRPDANSLIRSKIQSAYKAPGSRSSIDTLMQSTFMELGSSNTYDTLTDTRSGDDASDDKGLIEPEKNFTESVVDNNGGKTSLTYQNVDENGYLRGYLASPAIVQQQLLASINSGSNVIIGITETDQTKRIIGGHEITVIGAYTNKNGEVSFVCNDTDDDQSAPVEMTAKELIPKIHHAGIPNKVLNIKRIDDPYKNLSLLKELKTQHVQPQKRA